MKGKLFNPSLPLACADGLGVNSTAALIGLERAGIRPDLIIFSDTGGEKDETYQYIEVRRAWLKRVGFPDLEIVRYVPKNFKNWPPYYTLEDNCLTNATLPSLAFGFKSCSLKWKVSPQNKFVAQWKSAQDAWAAGFKVQKVVGYDAGPADLRRRNHAGNLNDPQYDYFYPLIEWGLDRQGCIDLIRDEGEPVPPKSSCFFCPAMKPHEVDELPEDKLMRIVKMELRAAPRLTTVQGLWRTATKKKPGSITEYIRERGLLSPSQIDEIKANICTDIVSFQEGYADAKARGAVEDYLAKARNDYRNKVAA